MQAQIHKDTYDADDVDDAIILIINGMNYDQVRSKSYYLDDLIDFVYAIAFDAKSSLHTLFKKRQNWYFLSIKFKY